MYINLHQCRLQGVFDFEASYFTLSNLQPDKEFDASKAFGIHTIMLLPCLDIIFSVFTSIKVVKVVTSWKAWKVVTSSLYPPIGMVILKKKSVDSTLTFHIVRHS